MTDRVIEPVIIDGLLESVQMSGLIVMQICVIVRRIITDHMEEKERNLEDVLGCEVV